MRYEQWLLIAGLLESKRRRVVKNLEGLAPKPHWRPGQLERVRAHDLMVLRLIDRTIEDVRVEQAASLPDEGSPYAPDRRKA